MIADFTAIRAAAGNWSQNRSQKSTNLQRKPSRAWVYVSKAPARISTHLLRSMCCQTQPGWRTRGSLTDVAAWLSTLPMSGEAHQNTMVAQLLPMRRPNTKKDWRDLSRSELSLQDFT